MIGAACALAVAVALAWATAAHAQAGGAARGRQVFEAKQCGRCHGVGGVPAGGPALETLQRPQGAYELSGRLWNHAPAMFTVLKQEGVTWPVISETEMVDLMAYLQADPAHDPAPQPRRGQVTLVKKGCLKCHSFHGEGARVAVDLGTVRDDYAPPARWAARMWTHTPRISARAIEMGVAYPRFSGDEMNNLLGFLRTGGAGR